MDEKKVNQTLATAANAANTIENNAAGNGSSTTTTTTTTSRPVYNLNDPQRVQAINDMYDAQINSQRAALQESGDQSVSDAQANRDQIANIYQTQRNAAAVDWERQRRNFLEGANRNGINTGAGSQAQLALMGQQQRTQTSLGGAQAQAETEADRNIADIRRNTQAAINEAVSKNDYQRAAALLDEYNQIYTRTVQKAEALAQYGDFSGYAGLYGNEQAASMRNNWLARNPDVAYMMGQITEYQYNNLKNGVPVNLGLDANGMPLPGYSGNNGGGTNWYDDPWGYGGSGWNGSENAPAAEPVASGGNGGFHQSIVDAVNAASGSTEAYDQGIRNLYSQRAETN